MRVRPEEAARRQRIALVELRGAGKTTLGQGLAGERDWDALLPTLRAQGRYHAETY